MNPRTISAPCAGKTVVITGAAEDLSQAAAVAFATAGVKRIAMVNSSGTSDAIEKASQDAAEAGRLAPELFFFHLIIGEPASIDTELPEIHSRLGHVDILTNATEHISLFNIQRGTIAASDICSWEVLEASVEDSFVVARILLPLLLKGTEKTFVNLISARSPLPQPTSGTHGLSEFAMIHLSECLMLDYGNKGLLAYSLQPGHYKAEDMVNLKLACEVLVYLPSEQREWLGGRHLKCEDMCDVISRDDWDAQNDLLKIGTSVKRIPAAPEKRRAEKRRGRVPRSSY
ncbi:hypothetical protein N7537_008952 [Penicillium hordei]|uniref:Uncharacterized protein n=1 Tax=Penicillium hordei TaxID=40994 RepID=A0AAD6E1I0_9EURO|nr:uncharacterized protein N7537_008952 [Penicillium hordei]KAJ5598868.1 hypothetical protein N7537_008952 [Penicillium hordei]